MIPVFTIVLSMVGVAVITRPPMLTGTETFQTGDMVSFMSHIRTFVKFMAFAEKFRIS